MLSSPTLSHSFSFVLLQVCHLKKMFFIWGMLPFSVLMVLVGNKHDREEMTMFIVTHSPKMKVWKGMKEMKVKVRVKIQTNLTQYPCGSM
jgi:hypothetical protein